MRKITSLLIILLFGFVGLAQFQQTDCFSFKPYKDLIKNVDDLKPKTPSFDVYGYGNTEMKAVYNLKVNLLKYLVFQTAELENPLVDTILGQFAGELVKLKKSEYDVYKTKKKLRYLGKFTAYTEKFYY